ncbi:MAG: hypothetical protein LC123_10465 [Burkholderiales bacterium]|nr:hypothetical protein [Burkholderiales bacterium]
MNTFKKMPTNDKKPIVLGISGSTRSISGKPRQDTVIEMIKRSGSEAELRQAFRADETADIGPHVKQLGIRHGDGFNLFKSERKTTKRDKTFSNTEVALADALKNPADPLTINPIYDSGDALHPNDAGYEAMAAAIDLSKLQ